MSSEGFSALGFESLLQIVTAVCLAFFKFELAGLGLEARF
jgi:hypothetical protein